MITIAEVTDSILSKRNQDIFKNPDFNYAVSNSFMLQRWLTMSTEEVASILNETTNKLWTGLTDDKIMWYKLMNVIVPKTRVRSVYIKKKTVTVNKDKEKALGLMARNYEMSKKELVEAHNMFKFSISQYKEAADDHE